VITFRKHRESSFLSLLLESSPLFLDVNITVFSDVIENQMVRDFLTSKIQNEIPHYTESTKTN